MPLKGKATQRFTNDMHAPKRYYAVPQVNCPVEKERELLHQFWGKYFRLSIKLKKLKTFLLRQFLKSDSESLIG